MSKYINAFCVVCCVCGEMREICTICANICCWLLLNYCSNCDGIGFVLRNLLRGSVFALRLSKPYCYKFTVFEYKRIWDIFIQRDVEREKDIE